MTPAVPTDTCAVLQRLMALSEQAGKEVANGSPRTIVPRGVCSMLLRAMKIRDPGIILHGQRIGTIARGVSTLLGWEDAQRAELELAGLLHDLGKIGVPDNILRKPGKLSSEEYDFVSLYHHAAISLMQVLRIDTSLISMLTMLHHNFDGAGVEARGAGVSHELPLGPRILAVADAYDSLSSPKSYRRGMTHGEVMKILNEHSGSRYDGNVIKTLNRWHEADGDQLFGMGDPFGDPAQRMVISDAERDEVVVLTQILNILYQFHSLYDGFFIVDSNMEYCVWSDGMEELSGKGPGHTVGRSWQPCDVSLSPITQTARNDLSPREEILPQVMRNGRAQFASRVCDVDGNRQLSVDVYTMPILGDRAKVNGVVQLFRCKGGVRRQSREYVELKLAATRDALTGVANRGQLETQLRHLLDDYHNHEGARCLSVIFLDVDKFKNINDTYGHKAGDQVLVDLTRLLQHETYSGEIIARYGGEEFIVLCPDTDVKAAVRRAERLRDAIQKSSVGGVSGLNVTSSFGVSTAHLGDTVQTLMERADACLYQAKETGRNRTCWEDQDKLDKEEHEMIEEEVVEESVPLVSEERGRLVFTQDIRVSTSLELTAMKLNAFISTVEEIELTHQEQGFLQLRLGYLGFTRRWGSVPERQPVEMDIRFETTREAGTGADRGRTLRQVAVVMRPIGRIVNKAKFELRCSNIMVQLRSYLLGY